MSIQKNNWLIWGHKEGEGIAPKSSCFVGQSRDWTRHRKDVIIGSKWGRTGRISWRGACYSIPPHQNRLFVLKGNCSGIFWDKGVWNVHLHTLVLKCECHLANHSVLFGFRGGNALQLNCLLSAEKQNMRMRLSFGHRLDTPSLFGLF